MTQEPPVEGQQSSVGRPKRGSRSLSTGEGGKEAQISANLRDPHVSKKRARPKTESLILRCGGCDSEWSGLNTCHCAGCHQTFSGLTAFVKHRPTTARSTGTAKCHAPDGVGLELNGRWYPCWGEPMDEDNDFWASDDE
ncbi:hypothetical protein BJD55_gp105 [Gordonia phage Yvonnetastic]|uniref:Phage FDXHR zinc binding domain-containing protein n=1 Tax=Gordonia phage Yvonnetastic TaxID=1821566 RepID=A0A142K978_9CAUD|nr:hypothetical protein BJD55_gp105 [Gordonia phage Yvonnetastic]AMS02661.1 hypothetical protein SEA_YVONNETASTIC_117 [Gordonia phage Yvonnetastic]